MEKVIIKVATIIAVVIVLTSVISALSNRYYISGGEQGIAFKVDRITGKTWFIRAQKEQPTKPYKSLNK